ncbi:Acyl carrier protein [Myxococcus hansupus]|uniref:Acyl carrier protein n=1 Tax=Pseudomyxococcus hansupus TaxID=1297742 RepID=A0A0H4WPT5_9BACT|nr:acyl carrier protein [Myxococcus hansupus]AKQ63340.1 Acyl carrier protein [Myxococcus hansupus]
MVERELEVITEIHRIVADELEWKGTVEPAQDLVRDLQLDSLGLTVLAVGLENRFRIRLSEEDAQGVRTVGDLAKLVARRVAAPPDAVTEVGT